MSYDDSRKAIQNWRKNPLMKKASGDFEQKTKQNIGTVFDTYMSVRKANHHHHRGGSMLAKVIHITYHGHQIAYAVVDGEYIHMSGVYAPERTGARTLATYRAWLTRHGVK